LSARPTPAPVKRAAAGLGITAPLRRVKAAIRLGREGARLQLSFWIGALPLRRLRHALYRRLGMRLDRGARVHRGLEVRAPANVHVGTGSVIGFDSILDGRAGIRIGRHVNISSRVAIWTVQHDHRDPDFRDLGAPVVIGDRAWISFQATILPGVSVGEGAIVAAGAVVTKDVAPYAVVGGVPARVIERRFPQQLDYELTATPAPWFI
jgi:maltose O-acetyltransferase